MPIKNWSTTAASNNSASPNGAPEGMAPSGVNDTIRQIMADVRTQWNDAQWFDYGDSGISRASATSFKVSTDLTARYEANRRIKLYDATTLYGVIASSSYSAPDTTVNVTMDSGSLTTSLTAVALGILTPSNKSIPTFELDTLTVSGASQLKSTLSVSGAAVMKTTLTVEGASTLSGNAVAKGTLLVEGASTLSGNAVAKGNLLVEGTVTISGAATLNTTLSVGGEATISGTATFKTVVAGAAVADQSAMETATAVDRIVSPGRQHFHPGSAKCYLAGFHSSGTPTIRGSYNVSSLTDNAVGDVIVNLSITFSGANTWAPVATGGLNTGSTFYTFASIHTQSTTSVRLTFSDASNNLNDVSFFSLSGFGDL